MLTEESFAGLWESWRSPQGETIKSFAIITTNANNLLAPLHDRMPVVIAPDRWAEWLGEQLAPLHALKDLLAPYPEGAMALASRPPGRQCQKCPICSQPYPWGIGH